MSFAGIVAYQSVSRLLAEHNAYTRSSFSFSLVIELSCGLYRDRDSINAKHACLRYSFSNKALPIGNGCLPFLSGPLFLISSICLYTLTQCFEIGPEDIVKVHRVSFHALPFNLAGLRREHVQCSDISFAVRSFFFTN